MNTRGNKASLRSSSPTPRVRFVCALFEFVPSAPEELHLDMGDVIKVVHSVDNFWLQGVKLHNQEFGQFPRDFVEDVIIPKHSTDETLLYALDTFYPEADGDLPFDKGNIVVLERKINNEWGAGRCISVKGMFPLNYTDRLFPLTIASLETEHQSNYVSMNVEKQSSATATVKMLGSFQIESANRSHEGLGLARATMKLTAQLCGELSFEVGDKITITEVLDDGTWYKGHFGHSTGTFPASFVELLTPLKNLEKADRRNLISAHQKVDRTDFAINNVNNIAGYAGVKASDKNLAQGDRTDLKSGTIHLDHRHSEKKMQSNNIPGATIISSSTAGENCSNKEILYSVTAMHKFTSNSEEELSFDKGAEIPVFLEVDDHWLLGRVGNKEGYIARSYVAMPIDCHEQDKVKRKSFLKTAEKVDRAEAETTGYMESTENMLINKHHVYTAPEIIEKGPRHDRMEPNCTLPKQALAMFGYHARNKFDLTICAGDTLWVIRNVDENWVEVKTKTGQKGIVPSSYIQYSVENEAVILDRISQKGQDESSSNCLDHLDGAQKDETLRYETTNASVERHCEQTSCHPMPVLHEDALTNVLRFEEEDRYARQVAPFVLPKSSFLKPNSLPIDTSLQNSYRQKKLSKSISMDSTRRLSSLVSVNRSNSNPQSRCAIKAKDARPHLRAWQQARQMSSPVGSLTPSNDRFAMTEKKEQCQAERPQKLGFSRATNRSASMREKRSQQRHEDPAHPKTFFKIKSDSDLQFNIGMGGLRPRVVASEENGRVSSSTRQAVDTGFECRDTPSKMWYIDSASTTSTGSSSSYGESRTSHSVQSDKSSSDAGSAMSRKSASSTRNARRSAPQVPPHALSASEQTRNTSSPGSLWSPPVPIRKQSLQHDSRKQADIGSSSPEVSCTPSETTGLALSHSAPELPPRSHSTTSPRKKVPPMRPANPPRSRSPNTRNVNGGVQERVRNVTSRDMKDKIEKLRQDIEEYSRMKRNLENLYRGTLDGKERREITEQTQFVKANIKRLQNEFHNLIEGQEDHIYESIEQHIRPQPVRNGTNTCEHTLGPLPLPPPLDSPASIRKKRNEKRLRVASELVDTERDFFGDVTVTVQDIMNELIDRQISQTTIATLFANIVQVKDFSKQLLGELEEALQNEMSDQPDFEGPTIGLVFINNYPEMKEVYMPYCRNHDDAMTLIEKLNDDPDFMQAVQTCLDSIKSKVNVFDLGSFLIKPVQRFLKYPLLIEGLIKLTDSSTTENPSDHDKLILAHKFMQSLAKDINEDKRTKDLVRKYKEASSEGLSEKLGKLTIKSIKKKSSRISKKFGLATGISTRETKDTQFDEVARRFKTMERAAKFFVQNITGYCDKCRDLLSAESMVAQTMVSMVFECDQSHPVAVYQAMMEKMSGRLYRQFHDQVQLQVLPPVQSLVASFKSPQAIIDKRLDKLIDYERLQKHSDSKDKIEAAKHNYEALNKSLLDELPRLCDLGLKLLTLCTAIFAKFHRDFESKLLAELSPLLALIQSSGDGEPKIPSNMETYEQFRPAYIEAIHTISRLQVVPACFGALYSSQKGSAEPQRKFKTGPVQKHLEPNNSMLKQPSADREALRRKYTSQQLHVANKNHAACQPADLSCCEGDLVAVLKDQDPMGSGQKWFVDRGGPGHSTGFLPSAILRAYDPVRDEPLPPVLGSFRSNSRSPVPTPRRRSPTPSSRSASSADSGSLSGAPKPPLSPYALRETLKRGTLSPKENGSPGQLTDPDVLEAFAVEDEIFDDSEYEEYSGDRTSPMSSKQHFRAEYDFTARSDLELTVRSGSIVKLIMAHDTDDNSEWWLVSNVDAKQGYVPSSYLTKAEYL